MGSVYLHAPQPVEKGELWDCVSLTAGVKMQSNCMRDPINQVGGYFHLICARGQQVEGKKDRWNIV